MRYCPVAELTTAPRTGMTIIQPLSRASRSTVQGYLPEGGCVGQTGDIEPRLNQKGVPPSMQAKPGGLETPDEAGVNAVIGDVLKPVVPDADGNVDACHGAEVLAQRSAQLRTEVKRVSAG